MWLLPFVVFIYHLLHFVQSFLSLSDLVTHWNRNKWYLFWRHFQKTFITWKATVKRKLDFELPNDILPHGQSVVLLYSEYSEKKQPISMTAWNVMIHWRHYHCQQISHNVSLWSRAVLLYQHCMMCDPQTTLTLSRKRSTGLSVAFVARSRYPGQGWIIPSHRILWDAITFPCLTEMLVFPATKSSYHTGHKSNYEMRKSYLRVKEDVITS